IVLGLNTDVNFDKTKIADYILYISEKLLSTQQEHKAIEYLKLGIEILPDNPGIYEKLAVIYHLNDEFDAAKDIYNSGLKEFPSNASLLLGRALLFIQTGDTAKACTDLQLSANQGDIDAINLLEEFCK
ncbi:MAG: hypothetical protein GX879_04655, partial [Bacteroidales bacterium]|nr:hypothetical protein [Bacteroidales bacterium]